MTPIRFPSFFYHLVRPLGKARKRKRMSSNEGIPEQADRWVEFRTQDKLIKPSLLTNWVNINGVPG